MQLAVEIRCVPLDQSDGEGENWKADFAVCSLYGEAFRKEPRCPAFCIMNDHFEKSEAQFTLSWFDTVH